MPYVMHMLDLGLETTSWYEARLHGQGQQESWCCASMQVRLLENRLRDFMPARRYPGSFDPSQTDNDSQDANGIEIKSVDGYQGREKDVIVLSAVRSNTQGQVSETHSVRHVCVHCRHALCTWAHVHHT